MNDEMSEFLVASIVGLSGWFFGGLDGYIKVLIACTAINYITGTLRAIKEGKYSRSVAFWSIARKIIMFFFIGMTHIIDMHMLGNTAALRTAVVLFYVGNEDISIIENAEKLGVPIPKFLHGKFLSFSEENETQEAGKNNLPEPPKRVNIGPANSQKGGTGHEEP